MNVIVLAAASRRGGAVTILKQFLSYLPSYIGNDRYYVFKDGNVETPAIDGVEYIVDNNHSIFHRIQFDSIGLKKWCTQRNIKPDMVISFQNSASGLKCRQIIYYHQSLPFYPEKWNPFKADERTLFFYTKVYPLFVKRTLNSNVDVVVQTESLRKLFSQCYQFDYNKTHAFFPDVEKIEIEEVAMKELSYDTFNFVYPAIAQKYKRHKTLVEAVSVLKQSGFSEWNRIRIYFTFKKEDYPELVALIHEKGLLEQFVFLGQLSYQELLSYYKAADALLFPSTIETIGLPMLEAASFGVPVIATNRAFAKDVLSGYEGVIHLDSFSPTLWAEEIEQHCRKQFRYRPIKARESSWPSFFDLIKGKENKNEK